MAIKFKPFKVTESELNNLPIVGGQFIITTDTNKIFVDIDDVTRQEYVNNDNNKIELYPIEVKREYISGYSESYNLKITNSTLQAIEQDIKNGKIKTQMYTKHFPIDNGQTITMDCLGFSCQYIVENNSKSDNWVPDTSIYGHCFYIIDNNITSFSFLGEGISTIDLPVLTMVRGGGSLENGIGEDVILELSLMPADFYILKNMLINNWDFLVKSDILDDSNKIQSALLPSYVDDVLEYDSKSNFPTTGENGKIYVDTTTNSIYRWDGSTYIEIGQNSQDTNNDIGNLVETVSIIEAKQKATDLTIDTISTNINKTNGNIEKVETPNGYTLNENGLKIGTSENEFNELHNDTGTYYKDGETVLFQTTKDGTIIRDAVLYDRYYYGVDGDLDVANFKKDNAMFVAQLYTNENGEQGFGHFYNGGE